MNVTTSFLVLALVNFVVAGGAAYLVRRHVDIDALILRAASTRTPVLCTTLIGVVPALALVTLAFLSSCLIGEG